MKVFIVLNPEPKPIGYTSLKAVCKAYNVSYASATKGKRFWSRGRLDDGDWDVVWIHEIEIVKIKGRENNYIKKT